MTTVAIALFTRDLRVHDNPVLAAAARAEYVMPVFVEDPAIEAPPVRLRFLRECLADLDEQLRAMGAALLVRRGDVVTEVCLLAERTGAAEVHLASDVSAFAARRQRRLADALAGQRRALVCHDGVHLVVTPGTVAPHGRDHFAVFTPFHRRWVTAARREPATVPARLRLPPRSAVPEQRHPTVAQKSWPGGETEARARARRWLADGVDDYADRHDDLAADATSRLSPYLHFGCLSALDLANRAAERDCAGADAFTRQLAWRDFHHQVLAARPQAARRDYRPRGDNWRDDPQALRAWQEGQTGIPIVDAGMPAAAR